MLMHRPSEDGAGVLPVLQPRISRALSRPTLFLRQAAEMISMLAFDLLAAFSSTASLASDGTGHHAGHFNRCRNSMS